MKPDESPALKYKWEGYPFGEKVPKKVKALTDFQPLWIFNHIRVKSGLEPVSIQKEKVYPCWVNSLGAVTAIVMEDKDGSVGLKPSEFEVVEWW